VTTTTPPAKAESSGIELQENPHQKKHVEIKADEVAGEGSSKGHSLSGLKKRLSLRKRKD
jgi:hypothetical protein